MKISIVVPIFNCEEYIGDCIESVVNQTSPEWELILVNDGSTDKSAEICNSYSDKYPDKIFAFHKKNEGQFLTRKFGIFKCTGDYIGFLDADDLIDRTYVETLSKKIKSHNSPDTVCFGFVQFSNNMKREIRLTDCEMFFSTPEERKTVYKMIVSGKMYGSLWSKVFKRDIITSNIPDEKVVSSKRYAEDAYHSFDVLAKSGSILYLSNYLYYYRNNEQGFSQGFERRSPDYFNSRYLFELIENNLGIMGIDSKEIRSELCARNFNETVRYMLKYLRTAENFKRKKEIIDFDWSVYLLEGTLVQIKSNQNFKKSYINVWTAFSKKRYITILFREKIRKIIGW